MQIFIISLDKFNREQGYRQISELDLYFNNYLNEYQTVTNLIASNPTIQTALMKSDYENKNEVYPELYRITKDVRKTCQVSLYDAQGKMRWGTSGTIKGSKLPTRWGVLRKASDNNGMILYNDTRKSNPTSLYLARTITNKQDTIGYVVIKTMPTDFYNLFRDLAMNNETIIITDRFWNLIYTSDTAYLPKNMLKNTVKNFKPQENKVSVLKEKNTLSFLKENKNYGYNIFLTIPAGITNDALNLMGIIGIASFAVAMILCGIISFLLTRGLTKPINELKQAINKVEEGHLDTRINTNRRDEFGVLLNRFNQMNQNLQKYTKELIARQKEISEMRIRLLQAQLKPHFLYNSLDTIKWMAKMNEIESVVDVANDLAQILRCSINDNQFIPLYRELDVVESYIAIQKIRFAGAFKHSINVPEESLDIKVPKLILQPLVENSITHGLREKEDGKISIIGKIENNNLLLTVRDNGCGMSPKLVEKYNHADFDKDKGHFGIYNVNNILRLYYGQNYGIHITSKKNCGTDVTIILPAQRSEEKLG